MLLRFQVAIFERGGLAMMMDILMYLFETYIHSDAELQVEQDELEEELLRAGFQQKISTKPLSG